MRVYNTIRNSTVSLTCQALSSLLSFINRTFFIYFLGIEYLGLSGLFTNILSVLSLAELGIGTSITFCLYKPLAQGDKKRISTLMQFYQNAYRVIGCIVLATGLSLIPFLSVIIGEQAQGVENLALIYVLCLSNSVISYFFSYKRVLLSANQQEYINTINRMLFLILQNVGQFIVLALFQNYYLYLTVAIACTLVSNISISRKCDSIYPYLKDKENRLDKAEKKNLFKYVYAQTCHKIGGVAVNGTDNILLTVFLKNGLYYVGLYSNYTLICGVFKSLLNSIFNSVVASVGNLNATETVEKSKQVFDKMLFLNYLFYGFCSGCIFLVQKDFIRLWVGEEYLLSQGVVLIIVFNFFLSGMRQSCITYNTTLGLFWNDRFKPLFEAGINLVASIALIKYLGFAGVLLGTAISNLLTNFWVEPYILFKHGFKSKVSWYFVKYLQYFMTVCIATGFVYYLFVRWQAVTWVGWVLKAIACALLMMILLVLPYVRTASFRWMWSLFLGFTKMHQNRVD